MLFLHFFCCAFSKPKPRLPASADCPADRLHNKQQLQSRCQDSWSMQPGGRTTQDPMLLAASSLQGQTIKCERINIDTATAAVSAVKNNNNSCKLNQLLSSSCCEPDEFFSDISFSSTESEIFSDLSSLEAFDTSLSGLEGEPVVMTSGLGDFLGEKAGLDYCHQLLMLRQDL
jgi:hypothetical protein